MTNTSIAVGSDEGASVAAVGGGSGGSGDVQHDYVIICRNLTVTNITKSSAAAKTVEDTDFGAVLYIVVVLTFYSFGIIVMIVKYLKTEKKEMEEEMVLDSFFKGIPDKRIENEKQAVNRVAIQAFHTLTTSKRPRGLPLSTEHESCPNTVNNQRLLSPGAYRRERYSIQPMYIGASRRMGNVDMSDNDDNDDDKYNDSENESGKHNVIDKSRRSKPTHSALKNEDKCQKSSQGTDPHDTWIESKSQKSVLFSETANRCGPTNGCDFKDNGRMRDTSKGRNSKHLHQLKQPSASDNCDDSDGIKVNVTVPAIQSNRSAKVNVSDNETIFLEPSNSKENRSATPADSTVLATAFETPPLRSLSSPKNRSPKFAGKGFLASRKTMMRHPMDSPDLGRERNLIRMSSLDKGSGDGSSYDSSSSLLTRIHLAETFTPPLRTKSLQNSPRDLSRFSRSCLSNSRGSNVANCSSTVNLPSCSDKETGDDISSNKIACDEKLKLTAGKNVSSVQPSYDSTSFSKGLTTRVNILNPSSDDNEGSRSCLVTDL